MHYIEIDNTSSLIESFEPNYLPFIKQFFKSKNIKTRGGKNGVLTVCTGDAAVLDECILKFYKRQSSIVTVPATPFVPFAAHQKPNIVDSVPESIIDTPDLEIDDDPIPDVEEQQPEGIEDEQQQLLDEQSLPLPPPPDFTNDHVPCVDYSNDIKLLNETNNNFQLQFNSVFEELLTLKNAMAIIGQKCEMLLVQPMVDEPLVEEPLQSATPVRIQPSILDVHTSEIDHYCELFGKSAGSFQQKINTINKYSQQRR